MNKFYELYKRKNFIHECYIGNKDVLKHAVYGAYRNYSDELPKVKNENKDYKRFMDDLLNDYNKTITSEYISDYKEILKLRLINKIHPGIERSSYVPMFNNEKTITYGTIRQKHTARYIIVDIKKIIQYLMEQGYLNPDVEFEKYDEQILNLYFMFAYYATKAIRDSDYYYFTVDEIDGFSSYGHSESLFKRQYLERIRINNISYNSKTYEPVYPAIFFLSIFMDKLVALVKYNNNFDFSEDPRVTSEYNKFVKNSVLDIDNKDLSSISSFKDLLKLKKINLIIRKSNFMAMEYYYDVHSYTSIDRKEQFKFRIRFRDSVSIFGRPSEYGLMSNYYLNNERYTFFEAFKIIDMNGHYIDPFAETYYQYNGDVIFDKKLHNSTLKKFYKKSNKSYLNNLFNYQKKTINYLMQKKRVLLFGDPGAGKTRIALLTLLLKAQQENKPAFYILKSGQDTSIYEDAKALGITDYIEFTYKSHHKYNKKYIKMYDGYFRPGKVYIIKSNDIKNLIPDYEKFCENYKLIYNEESRITKEEYNKMFAYFKLSLLMDIVLVDEYDAYKNAKNIFYKLTALGGSLYRFLVQERFENYGLKYSHSTVDVEGKISYADIVVYLLTLADHAIGMSGTLIPPNATNSSMYFYPFYWFTFSLLSTPIYKLEGRSIFNDYNDNGDNKYILTGISESTDWLLTKSRLHFFTQNDIKELTPVMLEKLNHTLIRLNKSLPSISDNYKYDEIDFKYYNLSMPEDYFEIYKTKIDGILKEIDRIDMMQIFKYLKLLSVYSTIGVNKYRNKKLWMVLKLLEEAEENNKKLVMLFDNNVSMERFIEVLSELYDTNKILTFYGSDSLKKKMDNLIKFKENKEIVALFATINSISRSYNLPESDHVVFVELSLRPEENVQAFNRVCRPQQENNVTISVITNYNTIDQYKMHKFDNFIRINNQVDLTTDSYTIDIDSNMSRDSIKSMLQSISKMDSVLEKDNLIEKVISLK